jgi:hypothetical protein
MRELLKGKTAVTTGASKGIGRATAVLFAEEGANVVLTARGQEALDQAVAAIIAKGGKAIGRGRFGCGRGAQASFRRGAGGVAGLRPAFRLPSIPPTSCIRAPGLPGAPSSATSPNPANSSGARGPYSMRSPTAG